MCKNRNKYPKYDSSWTDSLDQCKHFLIKVGRNRYVEAKSTRGDFGAKFFYILNNYDGSQVHDREGVTFPDYPYCETEILQVAKMHTRITSLIDEFLSSGIDETDRYKELIDRGSGLPK